MHLSLARDCYEGQPGTKRQEKMKRNFAVWAIFVLAPLTFGAQISDMLALQAAGLQPDLTWLGQLRDAGLTGALLVAVYFLWRSREGLITKIDLIVEKKDAVLLEKDKQILLMVEHVTASQTVQVETNRELRKVIEEVIAAKREHTTAIEIHTQAIEALGKRIEGCPQRGYAMSGASNPTGVRR